MFWIIIVLVLFATVRWQMLGVVYGGDFLVLAAVPVMLCDRRFRAWVVQNKIPVAAGLAFAAGSLVCDLFNAIPREDMMRGVARNVIFVSSFFVGCHALLLWGYRRWQALVLAAFCSNVFWTLFYDPDLLGSWRSMVKFAGGLTMALLASYIVAWRSRFGGAAIALLFAVLYWWWDSRGSALISLVVGIATFVCPINRKTGGIRLITVAVIFVALAGYGVITKMSDRVDTFTVERQIQSSGARVTMALDAWERFLDRPMIGNGTWQHARTYQDASNPNLIVGVHSVLLQLTFEYGSIGFVFSVGIVGLLCFAIYRLATDKAIAANGQDAVILWWTLVFMLYSLFFSPFTGDSRFFYGFLTGAAYLYGSRQFPIASRERPARIRSDAMIDGSPTAGVGRRGDAARAAAAFSGCGVRPTP